MRDIADAEFASVVAKGLTLVDFYSTWCPPCKPVSAMLEKLEPDFPQITFVKVNIDDHPDAAARHGVGALPTLILFEDGSVVKEQLGSLPEPALRAWLGV